MAVDLRVPSHLRLAPDGRRVAFCVAPIGQREKDPVSAVYVTNSDGETPPRAITGSEHNNTLPRWSPDGGSLAFVSDRVERGEGQLHVIPASGGEPLRLTTLEGGIDQPSWQPDGRAIAFIARRKALAGEKEPDSDIKVASERWKPKAIATVPATGGTPALVGPAEGHVWSFAYSPDGSRIAAVVTETEDLVAAYGGVRLLVLNADGSDERELLQLSGFPGEPRWSEDGRQIAIVGVQLPAAQHTHVFVVDLPSGEVSKLDDRGMTPTWAAFAGDDLLVHAVETQQTRIDRTDPRGAEWDQLDLGADPTTGWIESGVNIHVASGTLAFTCAQQHRPPDVYIARIGQPALRLTDLNPQLAGLQLAEMESISWSSSDGREIHGWLLLPPDA
ncbi:MAG: TolB family protein, partial [Vicinamibacterales bacterium]